jgi:hypothetical protein
VVSEESRTFPDPAAYATVPVYDLLQAAARGYVGIDMRFIQAIVDRGEQAIPDLLRFGLEDREDDRVDLQEDLIAIFRQLGTPEAVPYFVECIRRQPEDILDDIIEGILPFREAALEPLLELYSELDEDKASDLAFLLASLGLRDRRILDFLLERLQYEAGDGAFCLALYGDPAAIPALQAMLAEVPERDTELRREIQNAISEIETHQPGLEPVTHAPFDIAAAYPETAEPPYEVLELSEVLAMLESAAPEHRAAAAEGLRNRKLTKETRRRILERARTDSDAGVRARCWEALADTDDKQIHAAMKNVVEDPSRDLEERGGAIVGLSNATDDPSVATRILEFYNIPELRAKALEAMWRSFDRQFADYFPPHLNDGDPEIRRQAVWGTGYIGIGAEASRLREMFDDEEFRHDALFAYALCVPAEVTRGRVRGLLRKIDQVAGGLSPAETELVQVALDQRLVMHGLEPVFSEDGDNIEEEDDRPGPRLVESASSKVGRNDACPCGSGKKYKKCHGA